MSLVHIQKWTLKYGLITTYTFRFLKEIHIFQQRKISRSISAKYRIWIVIHVHHDELNRLTSRDVHGTMNLL